MNLTSVELFMASPPGGSNGASGVCKAEFLNPVGLLPGMWGYIVTKSQGYLTFIGWLPIHGSVVGAGSYGCVVQQ